MPQFSVGPACSAAVLMVDGYRYVALGHGDRPTTLHAADTGFPICKCMGSDTLATHTIFMEQRFLSGH